MKVRIGISAGGESLGPDAMVALGRAIAETGFDSLWLPEVLTRPGPDPLVGLAWASGACPGLKIGTTMLLPGRNLVWLAKAVATLDLLSGGRFLLTFVPGLALGGERSAIGIPTAERGALMDDALPACCAGCGRARRSPTRGRPARSPRSRSRRDRSRTPSTSGSAATSRRRSSAVDVSPTGGSRPSARRPTPQTGKAVIDKVAAEHGRAISPEHFGVSLAYAPEGADLAALASSPLARRARGRPLEQIVPVGLGGLRDMVERFLEVGFSKFIVRPMAPPQQWRSELERLAGAVGGLQT